LKIRIYYHHTDCGGVVYYAKYLEFLEEARTEFFSQKGLSVKGLAEKGILFVVARQEIDYQLPAFYGDTLEVNTCSVNLNRASMEFCYEIKNQDNRLVSKAKTILACVDKNFEPQPIPAQIKGRFSSQSRTVS
jgi:acyl-CoA thioester hydrolase